MKADDLTDSEVDELLERFDQTDPKLQRRIIAQFAIDRERFRSALERILRAGCDGGNLARCHDLARDALAANTR